MASDELVRKLREWYFDRDVQKAADTIERLERELAEANALWLQETQQLLDQLVEERKDSERLEKLIEILKASKDPGWTVRNCIDPCTNAQVRQTLDAALDAAKEATDDRR